MKKEQFTLEPRVIDGEEHQVKVYAPASAMGYEDKDLNKSLIYCLESEIAMFVARRDAPKGFSEGRVMKVEGAGAPKSP